jgi:hypothetical protein
MLLPRRAAFRLLAAGAFTFGVTNQKGHSSMTDAPIVQEKVLQSFYAILTKYHAAPVPTPLDRASAIAFVSANATAATPPEKMRKLMRLAIFYRLGETAPAFSRSLTGSEREPADVLRAALCLIALAWIGDAAQQAGAQRYYRSLQDRADVDSSKNVILEVVEAFGPRESTRFHRQWIQNAISSLEGSARAEAGAAGVQRTKLTRERINALTEYLNIELGLVDRAFAIRQQIEAAIPTSQVSPLVACSLANVPDSTPQLYWWASMRLLYLDPTLRGTIAETFYANAGPAGGDPAGVLIRARALRAAEYFGYPLPASDRSWLAGQPDTGTDPLALRPTYYPRP